MADTWGTPIKDWATGAVLAESDLDTEVRDRMEVLANAIDGDSSASTIKHRHLTGTYAALPAAGETGRIAYVSSFDAWFQDNGTLWVPITMVGANCEFYNEHFVRRDLAADFTVTLGGSGTVGAIGGGRSGVGCSTGTTASSQAVLDSTATAYITTAVPAWFSFLVKDASAARTQEDLFFGFSDGGTNVIGVRKAAVGADVNWDSITTAASVSTTNALASTTGGGELLFHILVESASSVKFYVGNTLAATHTTNIPTVGMPMRLRAANKAAPNNADKDLNVFMVRWWIKR